MSAYVPSYGSNVPTTPTVVIDPASYGAVGGAVGSPDSGVVTGGTVFTAPGVYTFGANDVTTPAKIIGIAGVERTIVGHDGAGGAILSSSVSNGSTLRWYMGYDDTAAIDAANIAAETWNGIYVGAGTSGQGAYSGAIAFGGRVQLRPTGYLVTNSQASFDAGRKACIRVSRRCGFRGSGVQATQIIARYGTIGDVLANKNAGTSTANTANAWDDFLDVGDFAVFCNGGDQPSGFGYGIRYVVNFNNYQKVDVWTRMSRITVFDARTIAFFFAGRGENIFQDLNAVWAGTNGFRVEGMVDSTWLTCNSSGAKNSGFYLLRAAACKFVDCKSFYSGASGGNNELNCANWVIDADQDRNGQVQLIGCESQESRGSGIVIRGSGYNQLTGCLVSDPARATSDLGGGTRPSIRAAYRIINVNGTNSTGSKNTFSGCVHRPSVSIYDGPGADGSLSQIGTHTLNIDASAAGNSGDITVNFPTGAQYEDANCAWNNRTFNGSQGAAGAIIGGTGVSNGLNTGLRVNGVALT